MRDDGSESGSRLILTLKESARSLSGFVDSCKPREGRWVVYKEIGGTGEEDCSEVGRGCAFIVASGYCSFGNKESCVREVVWSSCP